MIPGSGGGLDPTQRRRGSLQLLLHFTHITNLTSPHPSHPLLALAIPLNRTPNFSSSNFTTSSTCKGPKSKKMGLAWHIRHLLMRNSPSMAWRDLPIRELYGVVADMNELLRGLTELGGLESDGSRNVKEERRDELQGSSTMEKVVGSLSSILFLHRLLTLSLSPEILITDG